jgi:hypothetical protein
MKMRWMQIAGYSLIIFALVILVAITFVSPG